MFVCVCLCVHALAPGDFSDFYHNWGDVEKVKNIKYKCFFPVAMSTCLKPMHAKRMEIW